MGNLPLFWWVPLGKIPEVAPSELKRDLQSDTPPQVLDVRTLAEYSNGHIEGAIHVPITKLRARVGSLPFERRRPVVTVCLTAHRSIPAVRVLKAHGFESVAQLSGGMIAWRKAGFATQSE